MHCFEFEMARDYLARRLHEIGLGADYDALDLADILVEHGITSIDQIPDIVSIARNLQYGIRFAA